MPPARILDRSTEYALAILLCQGLWENMSAAARGMTQQDGTAGMVSVSDEKWRDFAEVARLIFSDRFRPNLIELYPDEFRARCI